MKLKSFRAQFMGPYSAELFKAVFIPDEWSSNYTQFAIGTGESRAVASARAVNHLEGVDDLLGDIDAQLQCVLTDKATNVEGDEFCSVYCIIGIEVEDA